MNELIRIGVFSLLFGVGWGVAFKLVYPLAQLNAGMIILCALFGLVTILVAMGLWKLFAKITGFGSVRPAANPPSEMS